MNKQILKNFIRDHTLFATLFIANSVVIATFYAISTGGSVEWLYPVLLSAFILGVFILIRWFQYYPFNIRIQKGVEDGLTDLSPATYEQREISSVIEKMHQLYMERISNIQLNHRSNTQIMSQWIHNMKTPVSVIDLVIQKTQRNEMSLENAILDIQEENARLLNYLDQIMSLLRLEDFAKDYLPETLDLNAALRKVINAHKNNFIHNRVFPKVQSANEPIYVLSDPKWNEVILDQLISNAIKYSGNGEDPKDVFFQIERDKDQVLLRIRDEGIGIPEYDIHRVFEAFFTGENGRQHRNATGIGLYVCSVVAEKLGHGINLRSKVGQGTEVTITHLSKV